MKKSSIYTRSGDHGESGLVGGKRVPKTHPRLTAYGTLDELQAIFGCAIAFGTSSKTRKIITALQNDIFIIGSHLASEKPPAHPELRRRAVIKRMRLPQILQLFHVLLIYLGKPHPLDDGTSP